MKLVERLGVSDLRLIEHRSHPSVQEMAQVIGNTILQDILDEVTHSYGLLTDDRHRAINHICEICR